MTSLGTIAVGDTKLAPRLVAMLEQSGLEREEFEELDWFGLLPFFALAGASVTTHNQSHGDHYHFQGVELTIDDGSDEGFYGALEQMLEQLVQVDGGSAEPPAA